MGVEQERKRKFVFLQTQILPQHGTAAIGANAALLSAQILALSEPELAKKLDEKRAADAKAVLEKDAAVSAELNSEV